MGLKTWLGLKALSESADFSHPIAKMWRRPPLAGVTCFGKDDGGGAQVHAVISAILFSKAMGVPYFHAPFRSIAHSPDPEAFAARWENAFNLGKGYMPPPEKLRVVSGKDIIDGYRGSPAILAQEHFHGFAEKNVDLYKAITATIRANLILPPPAPRMQQLIAVHVRRGDVAATGPNSSRYTENKAVARAIYLARGAFPSARTIVFSEGKDNFDGLPADCDYALNTDIFEAASEMINADCLIMAKSSLSYVAGLLSRGVVYYDPFWHKPLTGWRVLQ